MKQCLIAIVMVLALGMNVEASAQKHRHTPRTEQVDSTKNNQDAIEAFSDTTAVADAEDAEDDQYITRRSASSHGNIGFSIMDELDGESIAGMVFVLLILLTLFLIAPIGIIVAIFYFVNKNRREKYKLAQMAMQNGQPIPNDLLKDKPDTWDANDYQTGLRQMFTGAGLAIFLGIVIGKLGIGIGALVFFIGLGKWYVAREARNRAANDAPNYHQEPTDNNNNDVNI